MFMQLLMRYIFLLTFLLTLIMSGCRQSKRRVPRDPVLGGSLIDTSESQEGFQLVGSDEYKKGMAYYDVKVGSEDSAGDLSTLGHAALGYVCSKRLTFTYREKLINANGDVSPSCNLLTRMDIRITTINPFNSAGLVSPL